MADLKLGETRLNLHNPSLKDTVFSFTPPVQVEEEENKGNHKERFWWVYVTIVRKVVLLCLLSLNLVSYGLSVEYTKRLYDYTATRILELVLLPLLAIDLILVTMFLVTEIVLISIFYNRNSG